jgi:hypothetical protein
MEEYFDENISHKRAKKRLIRVTFEDGKSICYTSTTMTFMEALRRIGIERLQSVNFKVSGIPFITQTKYPKYEKYQKELVRGWYVMTQSDSGQKFRQLLAIKDMLGLELKVELGDDFETDKVKTFQKERKGRGALLVKFPDGAYIGGENPIDTYKETILKIGIEDLRRRHIEFGGKPLIANTCITKAYTEITSGAWLAIPSTTKEKAKYLKIIGVFMRIPIDVTIID